MDRDHVFRRYPHHTEKRAEVPMHSHSNGQLNYVSRGTMQLVTPNSSWVVPHKRLVWIPPNQPHSVRCQGISGSWKAMVPRSYLEFLPKDVCVLQTTDLLVAALQALPEYGNSLFAKKLRLLKEIIRLELTTAKRETFGIAFPLSRKLRNLCDMVLEHPERTGNLDQWAKTVGMSRRTFTRAFVSETGSSFGAWRRALLLEKSLQFLGEGLSVNETADRLGYSEPSAFVVAFRRRFGVTPGQFFS